MGDVRTGWLRCMWVGVGCIAALWVLGACAREVDDGGGENNASNNAENNSDNNAENNNALPPDIEVEGDPVGTTYGQGRFTKEAAGFCSWHWHLADEQLRETDDGYCTSDAECDRFGEGYRCDPEIERCRRPCNRHDECDQPEEIPTRADSLECEPYPMPLGTCGDPDDSACFGGNNTCPEPWTCLTD